MDEIPPDEMARLLKAIHDGNTQAVDDLFRLTRKHLRRMAVACLRHERDGHTLEPSDLVQEAFVRLLKQKVLQRAQDHRYFFGAAAKAMFQILVDHARNRKRAKRSGPHERVSLDALLEHFERHNGDVLALQEALAELATIHERPHEVVMLRFFGGLAWLEVADQLHLSEATVRNDFRLARAWLYRYLQRS